jgi:hypothetical protein
MIENFDLELDKRLRRIEVMYQSGKEVDGERVWRLWRTLDQFLYRHEVNMGDIKRLIRFGEASREFKGSGRNIIEEGFFDILIRTIASYHNRIDLTKNPFPIDRGDIEKLFKSRGELKNQLYIFLEIEKFALDSYHYKRPRDSFAGKRRTKVLEIIQHLLDYFKYSQGVELAKISLRNKGRDELNAAFELLKDYHLSREMALDIKVVEELDRIVEKTTNRSMAVGALSVMVDTGYIDEMEALFKIDEWKDKNYHYPY